MAINWEQRLSPIQGKPECTQSGSSVRQSTGRGVKNRHAQRGANPGL